MTLTADQLLENFKTQQLQAMDEIHKLEVELNQKKEMFVKLQGAIEGLTLLNPEDQSTSENTLSAVELEEDTNV